MKLLSANEVDSINNYDKTLLFISVDGCRACSVAKPVIESMENKYVEFTFCNLPYSPDILEFYNSVIPKEPVKIQKILSNGSEVTTFKLNEDNTMVLEAPLVFPNFLFFTKENGFIGNIAGFSPEGVEHILSGMST